MTDAREHMLRVRVTEDERRQLFELAEADGLSASDVVRLYIRREHAARFGRPTAGSKAEGPAKR